MLDGFGILCTFRRDTSDIDTIRDEEGGIKPETESADKITSICAIRVFRLLQEFRCTRFG